MTNRTDELLDAIRSALNTMFEEIHHPGYMRQAGVDLGELHAEAIAALNFIRDRGQS